MMLDRLRGFFSALFTPIAKGLLRLGISPDVVTVIGTLGVAFGALFFFPRGELFVGVMVITAFVFSDLIDGTMARLSGRSSKWGSFLDSTLDRIADAAIFAGLVVYFTGVGDSQLDANLAMACLAFGQVVSYARAKAESVGLDGNVGIAERAERLVAVLVATGIVGLGVHPTVLTVVLALLAIASFVTIVQRVLWVRKQSKAELDAEKASRRDEKERRRTERE